jgi:hypothetical protein
MTEYHMLSTAYSRPKPGTVVPPQRQSPQLFWDCYSRIREKPGTESLGGAATACVGPKSKTFRKSDRAFADPIFWARIRKKLRVSSFRFAD